MNAADPAPVRPAISARGLTKRYRDLLALDRLDLDVARGQIFGFLGPNGAGKSTTIRCLAGLIRPTSGTAVVAGHDVVQESLEVKRRVGYMAERPYLYLKLSAREFLHVMADLHRVPRNRAKDRSEELLRLLHLEEKADQIIQGYSHGMRQKTGLAGALIHDPEVLFLDEPTSGLDPRSARTVRDLLSGLAREGKTVFLSTHVLDIAQHMCQSVAIVNRGRLVAQGTLDELRARSHQAAASLEEIFLELTGDEQDAEVADHLRN